MRKDRVNEILVEQTKRRRGICSYICLIIVLSVIALSFLVVFVNKSRKQYVSYEERGKVDYEVYLKSNEFFEEEYLERDQQYIASLIDYITADFYYEFMLEGERIDYQYSYEIVSIVNVKDKVTGNTLYEVEEVMLEEKTYSLKQQPKFTIEEEVEIDYHAYNNLIKKFISTYDLDGVDSTLTIDLIVRTSGSVEEEEEEKSVVSLVIPLTSKTMAIDISSNLVANDENVLRYDSFSSYHYWILILFIVLLILDIYMMIRFGRYVIETKTKEGVYARKLRKILNNYGSYIQKVNNELELEGYQVLKIDTFHDMLEIRDTIQSPILMVENKEKTRTYFVIPSSKILYTYCLKVKDSVQEEEKYE